MPPASCATRHRCSRQAFGPLLTGNAREDKTSFGYNWTEPLMPLKHPWIYHSDDFIGSSTEGQMSAALPSMRFMPNGGFVALIMPFFSTTWIEEERGLCDPLANEVTWYQDHYVNTTSVNKRAAFYCLRLSWNGRECHQLCDETDIGHEEQMRTLKGRNTGVVRAAVELFWNDMKRAHFIDAHTRVMTITMQLNSNHIGIRYRVTLMFELTSLGAVLPSYDMETRVEDEGRAKTQLIFMNIAMALCGFFVLLEGIEIFNSGVAEYFSDMWNIMDWLNFTIFFLVWNTLRQVQAFEASRTTDCAELCTTTGYRDDWRVMSTSRTAKLYLSLCVCIQLLKIIKFTNVLIPKMGLMTAVLGKGFADLAFFGIVFIISMMAFCMMFYVQLGSVMEDFNDQTASFISLARALFGDFDIDDIMNNSSGYLNAVLFLVYLFVAVFILLSMFLAILGEAQAAVRGEQDAEEEAGTAPPAYGVFSILAGQLKTGKARLMAKVRKRPYPDLEGEEEEEDKDEKKDDEKDDKERAVKALKLELTNSLGGIRSEVGRLAQQVTALAGADADAAAKPAAAELGSFEDARALRKVVETLEQRMTRKLTQIDERLARGPRASKSGQRSRPPPAAGEAAREAAAAGEGGGGQSRRRRTPAAAAQAAAPEYDQTMTC